MARNKNSPALFEVIRNAQQKQKEQLERQRQQELAAEIEAHSPAAALLRSPLYWFKGKQAHEAAKNGDAEPVMREVPAAPARSPAAPRVAKLAPAVAAPVEAEAAPVYQAVYVPTPSVVTDETDLVAEVVPHAFTEPVARTAPAYEPEPTPEPVYVAPAYTPAPTSAAAEAARQVREELSAQDAPAAEPLFANPSPAAYVGSPFGFDDEETLPANNSHFHLKLNYTTAIVAGFAVMVAFVVAYIIGTAGSDHKVVAKVQPTHPEVLDVSHNTTPAPTPTAVASNDNGIDDARANVPVNGGSSMALDTIGKPIPMPTNVKRVIGRQYVVLMSFPPAMEKQATDIVKYLAQNGVPVTAEKALPGFAKTWTSIVTVVGFDHTKRNPAYDAYVSAVKDVLQKSSGDTKFARRIDNYTWRAPS